MSSQGCVHQGPNSKGRLSATKVISRSNVRPCPDRVDTARAGGLAGTVLGTIVGSVFGMPLLGLVYKVAGYGIGFATGNSCNHIEQTGKNGKMEKLEIPGGKEKLIIPRSQPIKEETL